MDQTNNRHRLLLRWGLTLISILSAAGAYAFNRHIAGHGWLAVSVKLQVLVYLMWVGLAVLTIASMYAWSGGADRLLGWLDQLAKGVSRLNLALIPVMLILLAAFPVLLSGKSGLYLNTTWTRQAIFAWLIVFLAICVAAFWKMPAALSAFIAAMGISVVYHLATYIPHVNNYPFTLWWSETTRYYLASTFLDQQMYGQDLPWTMKDLTRYLIQAVPFLIEDSPLWVHRLWQALLRFTSTYVAGFLLARRYDFPRKLDLALFSIWAGLFLFQGPVFYHLIVVVMLVYWLAAPRNFWRTLFVVVIASAYAGFSRVNWVPMAAILVLVLYLLEVPVQGKGFKSIVRYLWKPAVWTLAGLAAGLGAQQYWYLNSGNPVEIYESSFTSYMLWDRLFPNPSYTLGILPAILLISAPLLIYLIFALKDWRRNWHGIRLLGLGGIIVVMFAGGLLVSVKIGGGTNLHNMDLYLVVLLTIAAELYMGKTLTEGAEPLIVEMPLWLISAAVAVPVVFIASFGGLGTSTTDFEEAYQDLERLQKYVDQVAAEGGDVLFISQRHLLTFDLIENVPLVHDYEKMLLQEMVMGKNETYLAEFGADMAEQRYAMIVTDPMPMFWKDPEKASLAMENNVVNKNLVPLIFCAYEKRISLLDGRLDILVPLEEPTCVVDQE